MTRPLRTVATAATVALLAGSLAALAAPAAQAAPTSVSSAVLEWTGNAEAQGKQPFGGCSFFTAGATAPKVTSAGYIAQQGAVKVVKSTGALATWATRCAGEGTTHQRIVVTGGTGTVDPATGAADIQWTGTWSVNFYGGLIPFSITNPRLVLAPGGNGQITATLAGFGGEMGGSEVVPIEPHAGVVIATISSADSTNALGFPATPKYAGVPYAAPSGAAPQNRVTAGWGSWPTSFVAFHENTGLASYWYSSGGVADSKKAPLPVVVRYGLGVAPTATRTALATAPAGSSVAGKAVRLAATASPAVAGRFVFRDGNRTLATVAAASGRAALVVAGPAVGRHTLTATFVPTNGVAVAGSSAARALTVTKARSKVALALAKRAVRVGARGVVRTSVTLAGTPLKAAGKVQVRVGAKVRAVGSLNRAGKVSVALPPLPVGTYKVSVRYPGSAVALGSVSGKATLRVVR